MDKALAQRSIEITFGSAFPAPVSATHRGEPVSITHVGNAPGMSPVYLVVDNEGQSAWVPQKDCLITDSNFLPNGSRSSSSGSESLLSGQGSGRSGQPVG